MNAQTADEGEVTTERRKTAAANEHRQATECDSGARNDRQQIAAGGDAPLPIGNREGRDRSPCSNRQQDKSADVLSLSFMSLHCIPPCVEVHTDLIPIVPRLALTRLSFDAQKAVYLVYRLEAQAFDQCQTNV